jgi:predicted dehydrogenase
MPRLRLSVIGAGSWVNSSHLPVLAERGDVAFVGVCRRGREDLERVRDRWGFQVASEEYKPVLDIEPDIVIVASPSAYHFEHAQAALLAGAHVLVEKPFTLSSRDAWRLVEIAKRVDRQIVVSLGYNFKPVVTEARALLERTGGVGEIESMLVSMSSGTRGLLNQTRSYPKSSGEFPPEPQTWVDAAISGGGYGQAQLPHALGAALYLTGLRAEKVYAAMAPMRDGVELNDALAVHYRSGAIGTVTGTSAHPGFLDERDQLNIRVVGSSGQLDMEFERDRVAFHRDGETLVAKLREGDGSYDCIGPPNALADLALGRDVVNHAPGELGARTTELLEAAYRSAGSGAPASIESTERS